MMFDEDTMTRIHYEIKTETRRLYNPNRRPAVPGHTHKIKIDRTPNTWGEIKILSCEPQRFGDLTLEDARNEGFFSVEEYKKYFYEVNGHISDDDLVWVIKFEKIWTSFFVEEPIAIEL